MLIHNAVMLSKVLLGALTESVKTVADLTAGNGHDTLYLLDHFPDIQWLLAMDIQSEALEKSRTRLEHHAKRDMVHWVHDGHEKVATYVPLGTTLDLVVYNLGYLPGNNKHITTMTQTTIQSVQAVLDLLTPSGGLMSIVCYPGHDEGSLELTELESFFSTLDQKQFNILKSEFINQVNHPPVSILIQKR